MFLTDEARYVGYATAFEIPLPRAHQPATFGHDRPGETDSQRVITIAADSTTSGIVMG